MEAAAWEKPNQTAAGRRRRQNVLEAFPVKIDKKEKKICTISRKYAG